MSATPNATPNPTVPDLTDDIAQPVRESAAGTARPSDALAWRTLCARSDLVRGSGIVALVDGEQVAVFQAPDDTVYAIENRDPRSGANVIGRGLVGQAGDALYVAAPLYKQRFRLADGFCLDDPAQRLRTWPVRVRDDVVEIA